MGFKRTLIIAIMAATFVVVSCQEGTTNKTKSFHGFITFAKGKVTVNEKKAKIGQRINQTDQVVTGKKSAVIIQFAQGALVAVKANTALSVEKLAMEGGKPSISLNQSSGSTFHKIAKGKAKYHVSTPTAVAGVRGTSFNISMTKKQTKVSLLHGKLAIENKKTKEKQTLEKKKSVKVSDQQITKAEPLTEITTKRLKALDEIPFDKAITQKIAMAEQEKNVETSELAETKKNIEKSLNLKAIQVPDGALKNITGDVKQPTSLVGLKKKYGVLYQVSTKDGRVFIGALKTSGSNYIIITPKRSEVIKKSSVLKKNKITGPF